MPRYFIEVAYDGSQYAGFQIQENANTIQAEVEKALRIFYKKDFELTGSSRTDTGVHALQNYFHFDAEEAIPSSQRDVYHINAILPDDITLKNFFRVGDGMHCRFDAQSREYKYFIYTKKNPFLRQTAFFFPFKIDVSKMQEAAAVLKEYSDFTSFSKKHTQAKNFNCDIRESEWLTEDDTLVYHVVSNRFLRGMVKGLVGTMLRVGRGKMSLQEFREVIEAKDCSGVDFSVASHGLFLVKVNFGDLF
ncbi:MAG: tRNA pseudouridine(38-40) synthase TruA [Chitinophagaceae bacterium]|nr:tRNA pseudouridine(38-40) synthase TruA [Chitinophagaceae bacterium]